MTANDNTNALLYPPLPPDELKDAHAYENFVRIVVTQNGVWGRSRDGGWVGLKPLSAAAQRHNEDGG